MEQIILVKEGTLHEVNNKLREGWKVKQIVPFNQIVAMTGNYGGHDRGLYGAYVVIEK